MPTIDQLESAIVASDEDVLPVSQNGIARRISRSQLLAGTQQTLSIGPGILGRTSPGLGPPQQVTVGGGLLLSNGVLSGSPRFSTNTLPVSQAANLTDLVPLGQSGQDNAVTIRTLLSVSGVDVSHQTVKADLGLGRRLSDWVGDSVAVEAFGAYGDGITDDSRAISLAIASGRPVLFGPKTYRVDGQWNVQSSTSLIGIEGMTVLRRGFQTGGAWVNVTAPSFTCNGIIFDAGAVDGDSWAVLTAPTCTRTLIRNCSFINATGAVLGTGLTIQARDGLTGHGSTHRILNCRFENNACHGVWVQAASDAVVSHCQASNNGGFGICLDFNDPLFQQTVRQCSVTNSRCFDNTRGISIGNFNETNAEPPRWGLDNPDALDIIVAGNLCSGNTAYGMSVSGTRIQVSHNQIQISGGSSSASGILCNASVSTLTDNSIVGPGVFGIDAGGSADLSITSNVITDCNMGINAGGGLRVKIAQNMLLGNARALTLFQVETDGLGRNFGQACSDTWIEDNLIQIDPGCYGILLLDGPERVLIARNRFLASTASDLQNLCWAHTDSVVISDNTLNGSAVSAAASQLDGSLVQITIPDVLDRATLGTATTKADVVVGLHQSTMAGQVSFIRVVNSGQGYTQAQVVITGLGSGALASAYIRDGKVIGIALSSGGSGYDPTTTSASILGDGSGATLHPMVGLPVAQDRRLFLRCSSPVRFSQGNANGILSNWTNTDFTVAASSELELLGDSGSWQAVSFETIDYVQPGSDGSVSFRSAFGDVNLNTSAGNGVRFRSDNEQLGFLSCFGRGSPEGQVKAPPGSDYRNLNGGIGATLWLKQVGTDSSGWFAIA